MKIPKTLRRVARASVKQLRRVIAPERVPVADSQLEGPNRVDKTALVHGSELGAYSYVGRWSILSYARVGRFCSIGPGVILGGGVHPVGFVSTSPIFYSARGQCGEVWTSTSELDELPVTTIGHDVWIGAGSFVASGIRVGNGAIIAAGAVVTADVDDYKIVGGVPAKFIRDRFSAEQVRALQRVAWWDWPIAEIRAARARFATDDIGSFLAFANRRDSCS